ncbi:hypothetical protein HMI54_006340 [Coelomomyces lativittatus]|nr:hypothetical protein HMI54_006340 [Coelomomyces lativittatus]KAJ1507917.1 hypothetical protein HMI56_007544 [Coelomomyces lativittatus]
MDDCLTLFTTDPEYQRTSVVSTIPPPTLTSNDISYLKKKRTSSNRHTSHVSSTTSHDNLPKPTYSKRKFTHELQMKEKRLDPTLPILKDRIYHHSVHDTQVHPSTLLHPPSLQHQLGGKSMEDRMELNEAIKLTSRLHGEREQELQPQKINQPTTSLKEPNDHDNLSKEIDQSNAPTEKEKEKVSSTSNPSVCITESKRKGSRFTHVPSDYSTLSTTKEVQDTHLSSVSPSVPPLPPSDVLEWYSTPIDASVPTQEEDIKSSDEV